MARKRNPASERLAPACNIDLAARDRLGLIRQGLCAQLGRQQSDRAPTAAGGK